MNRKGFEAMASVLTVAEGVATISLCREKERNPLDGDLVASLTQQLLLGHVLQRVKPQESLPRG